MRAANGSFRPMPAIRREGRNAPIAAFVGCHLVPRNWSYVQAGKFRPEAVVRSVLPKLVVCSGSRRTAEVRPYRPSPAASDRTASGRSFRRTWRPLSTRCGH